VFLVGLGLTGRCEDGAWFIDQPDGVVGWPGRGLRGVWFRREVAAPCLPAMARNDR